MYTNFWADSFAGTDGAECTTAECKYKKWNKILCEDFVWFVLNLLLETLAILKLSS